MQARLFYLELNYHDYYSCFPPPWLSYDKHTRRNPRRRTRRKNRSIVRISCLLCKSVFTHAKCFGTQFFTKPIKCPERSLVHNNRWASCCWRQHRYLFYLGNK
ncbi:MAG TPA: hypothetical protein DDW88_01055 [Treponema sp.]|nr:hypothetical protein [Treponema sp.]